MSGSGGGDIVHGAPLPTPPWWRPFRDLPLAILGVLSLVAAIVGWTVQHQLESSAARPAAVVGGADADVDVSAECRAPLPERSAEPWINSDGSAEQAWAENADALAAPVVLGEDGWAFYNDQVEENFSQTVGRRYLTVGEVDSWVDYFTPVAKELAAKDIEFSLQITPSAGSVYPQQLPDWVQPLQGSTPLDQLLVAAPDLPIVDFRYDLREASESETVFTPVNSHWTDWGGYIGWQTYANCHDVLYPDSPKISVPEVSGTEVTRIYNEYANYAVPDAEPMWNVPVYVDELADVEVVGADGARTTVEGGTPLDLTLLPATTRTKDAASEQTALILRDSMGGALSAMWAQQYGETWQIQHRYDDWSSPPNFAALVAQYNPNVVIVQLAERHLVNAPAPGVTSGF